MPIAKINSKGQLTVPKRVREHLGVGPGDALSFQITDKGDVVVTAATVDVRLLKDMLKRSGPSVSLAAMNRAIRRGATGR